MEKQLLEFFLAGLSLVGIIALLVGWPIYTQAQLGAQLGRLRQSGFSIDHLLEGTVKVAFDDTNKKVAFVFRDDILHYAYEDIKQWQWHWLNNNGRKTQNMIHFTLRDKNRPLIKVGNLNTRYAEHWVAKLDAIING